jgi:hypothetical protein
MPINHVTQDHYNGCFVAALAMILGKTYPETFQLLFPDRDIISGDHALRCEGSDRDIGGLAAKALEKFGVKAKKSTYKKVKSLLRYARKNVLLIIRWHGGPLCHAVVFDAETKKFLDPSGPFEERDLKSYQRNLDSMYYIEPKAA